MFVDNISFLALRNCRRGGFGMLGPGSAPSNSSFGHCRIFPLLISLFQVEPCMAHTGSEGMFDSCFVRQRNVKAYDNRAKAYELVLHSRPFGYDSPSYPVVKSIKRSVFRSGTLHLPHGLSTLKWTRS